MVKSSKIISVDLNFPSDSYQEIQEEAKEDIQEEQSQEEIKQEPVEVVKPKRTAAPKRKAAPKKEPVKEVEIEEVKIEEPKIEEPKIEPKQEESKREPKQEVKQTDKVKCQHCNKEMTAKSLRYSHSQNCLGLKKTLEKAKSEVIQKTKIEQPVKIENATQIEKPKIETTPEPVKVIINPRQEKMIKLKERYNNLAKNAFN